MGKTKLSNIKEATQVNQKKTVSKIKLYCLKQCLLLNAIILSPNTLMVQSSEPNSVETIVENRSAGNLINYSI